MWKQCQTLFFWSPKSLQMVIAAMKLKDACSLEGKLWPNLDSILNSRDITLPTKVHLVKAMVFPAVMYGCESWTVKKAECWRIDAFVFCFFNLILFNFTILFWFCHISKWCFWSVVLDKTLESPLDCKEIQPIHPKWDQPWVFIERTDAKAETPILWPPHAKSWLTGKGSDAGRDWGQEEKGRMEDEMGGWHQGLNGHEFEWTLVFGDGPEDLACCNSWGRKESDMTEWLTWTELMVYIWN